MTAPCPGAVGIDMWVEPTLGWTTGAEIGASYKKDVSVIALGADENAATFARVRVLSGKAPVGLHEGTGLR